jgi:hypothetical protein
MKKILIILGSYFPKPSPNGICVKQVASELKNRGIEVTILATKSRGLTDSEIIDSVIVHRIKPRLFQRMVEWCDSNRNVKLSHIFRKIALIINKINNILFFPLWPLVSPLYTYRYYKKAKELPLIVLIHNFCFPIFFCSIKPCSFRTSNISLAVFKSTWTTSVMRLISHSFSHVPPPIYLHSFLIFNIG